MVPGHTKSSCKLQWQRTQNLKINKSSWTKEEDEELTKIVNKFGTKHWSTISLEFNKYFPDRERSRKQCRDRWLNYLDPSINK